jgi:outer membrane protein assembly factor BamE (lipoprotein component of BamABCDE complex)
MGRLVDGMRLGALILTLVLANACTPVYRNHGYVPLDSEMADLVVGESNRQDVADFIGRPSSMGMMTDGGWYYVGSRFRSYGGYEDREIDRQVVAVSFAEDGTVSNVERFGMERGKLVVISRRVTDSNIKGVGFLRQLLGSIGRVSADQLLE